MTIIYTLVRDCLVIPISDPVLCGWLSSRPRPSQVPLRPSRLPLRSLLLTVVVPYRLATQSLTNWYKIQLSRKKVELLIRFFEPFWILRVFHFSLRTFAKVRGLPWPLEPSDKTYTQCKFDISGSNETMQNALASKVKVWRIFEIFLIFLVFRKFELLCFSSNMGEICYGG